MSRKVQVFQAKGMVRFLGACPPLEEQGRCKPPELPDMRHFYIIKQKKI